MKLKRRTDCPKFKGWAALDWDVPFRPGDMLCYIGKHAVETQIHLTPETGYDLWGRGYRHSCASQWEDSKRSKVCAYRKVKEQEDPYTSRESPLPMNSIFSQVSPLP